MTTGLLELSRVYKNSSEDTIRVDIIKMIPTVPPLSVGAVAITYARTVETTLVLGATSDRVVSIIEIMTDADSYDLVVSGANNYNWVAWSRLNGYRCDMSDLPQIGDTV